MTSTTNASAIAIGTPIVKPISTDNDDAASTVYYSTKSHASDEFDSASQDLEYEEPSTERALALRAQADQLDYQVKMMRDAADAELIAAEEHHRAQEASTNQVSQIVNVTLNDRSKDMKFVMIIQPTQSGKTRQSTTGIAKSQELDATEGLSLNIVFTQNVRLSENQFLGRVKKDATIKGLIAVMTANPRKNTGDERHLEFASFDDPVFKKHLREHKVFPEGKRISTVIMCSHPARIVQTQGLLEDIDDLHMAGRNAFKRVFIHFDELHQSIGLSTTGSDGESVTTKGLINMATDLPFVHTVLGMSATPRKVLKAFESVPLVKYVDPNLDHTYIGLKDCRFEILDFLPDVKDRKNQPAEIPDYPEVQYQRWVLSQHTGILSAGAVVFAPSNPLTASHSDSRDLFLQTNPNTMVLTINGKAVGKNKGKREGEGGTVLHFYEDASVAHPKLVSIVLEQPDYADGEISDRLVKVIQTDPRINLEDRPIVITGNKCISTGATLVNSDTGPFQSAIIYGTGSEKGEEDLSDSQRSDMCQTFGRVTGRRDFQEKEGKWAHWCVDGKLPQTVIYCPGKVKSVVMGGEHSSFTLGNRAVTPGEAGPSNSTVSEHEERDLFLHKYRQEEQSRPHFKTRKELNEEAKREQRAAAVQAKIDMKAQQKADKEAEKAEVKEEKAKKNAEVRQTAKAAKAVSTKQNVMSKIMSVLQDHPGEDLKFREILELIKTKFVIDETKIGQRNISGTLNNIMIENYPGLSRREEQHGKAKRVWYKYTQIQQ